MATLRQNKVSRLLQKELGQLFQRDGRSLFQTRHLITVTVVRISPDLSFAKVYLSIFPSEGKEEVLERINKVKSEVRGNLGNKVRNQLRIVPELAFFIDDSLDYAERIDELLT